MNEPRLEDIEDYESLKGSKRRIVWGVIIVSLLIGVIYTVVLESNKTVDDAILVEEPLKSIPLR